MEGFWGWFTALVILYAIFLFIGNRQHESRQETLCEQVALEQRRLSMIHDITHTISSNRDLPTTYQSFAEKIKELLDYDRCVVVLLNETGEAVNVFLLAANQQTNLPKGTTVPVAGTSVEWVLNNGVAQFEDDLLAERMFVEDELLMQEGIRSAVRVPIRLHGAIIGLFILNSRKPACYSEADLSILGPVTDHLALAIERYFLFEEITRLSLTDELTGCGNRRMLSQEMEREIRRAERYGRHLGLLMLDIDHFKRVNDTYGHLAGDLVLKDMSSLIRGNVRDIDTCIRFGGEEFLVILPETDTDGAVATAEKIRTMVAGSVYYAGENVLRITVSVGIAVYPVHAESAQQLVDKADAALYRAKIEGRNRSYFSDTGVVQVDCLFENLETVT